MRIAKYIIPVLLAPAIMASAAVEQDIILAPTMEQRFTSNLATKLLTNWLTQTPRRWAQMVLMFQSNVLP